MERNEKENVPSLPIYQDISPINHTLRKRNHGMSSGESDEQEKRSFVRIVLINPIKRLDRFHLFTKDRESVTGHFLITDRILKKLDDTRYNIWKFGKDNEKKLKYSLFVVILFGLFLLYARVHVHEAMLEELSLTQNCSFISRYTGERICNLYYPYKRDIHRMDMGYYGCLTSNDTKECVPEYRNQIMHDKSQRMKRWKNSIDWIFFKETKFTDKEFLELYVIDVGKKNVSVRTIRDIFRDYYDHVKYRCIPTIMMGISGDIVYFPESNVFMVNSDITVVKDDTIEVSFSDEKNSYFKYVSVVYTDPFQNQDGELYIEHRELRDLDSACFMKSRKMIHDLLV